VAFYEHFLTVTYQLTSTLRLLFGFFGIIIGSTYDISYDVKLEEVRMNSNKEHAGYSYRLPRKGVATMVGVSSGDLVILKAYKTIMKQPMTAVLHEMIGTAVKCWEEKHVNHIKEGDEQVRTLTRIVATYLEKYGPIRPKGAETPVKGVKEEKAEEKGKPADKDAPSEQ